MPQSNAGRIALERLQGCAFLLIGLLLIYHLPIRLSLSVGKDTSYTLALGSKADEAPTAFDSAVRAIVGPGQPSYAVTVRPLAKELRIISATYGAQDTWIDVTEQIREKVDDNALSIRASNAIAGDPLYGVPKILTAEYILDGDRKTSQAREGIVLHVPPVIDPFDELRTITTPERACCPDRGMSCRSGFLWQELHDGKDG